MRLGLSCFIRSALFSKLLNLKELSFFVVCKKRIFLSSMKTAKVKGEKETKFFFKAIKHQYILFCISEWIKNKPSFKCWFSTIEETIFLFFFDSVFMICYAWSNKVSQVWESARLTAGLPLPVNVQLTGNLERSNHPIAPLMAAVKSCRDIHTNKQTLKSSNCIPPKTWLTVSVSFRHCCQMALWHRNDQANKNCET